MIGLEQPPGRDPARPDVAPVKEPREFEQDQDEQGERHPNTHVDRTIGFHSVSTNLSPTRRTPSETMRARRPPLRTKPFKVSGKLIFAR